MDLGLFGWIFVGLIAGSISGWFVGSRSVVVGGVLGGWLAGAMGLGRVEGLLGALVFATVGAVLIRLILRAIERD